MNRAATHAAVAATYVCSMAITASTSAGQMVVEFTGQGAFDSAFLDLTHQASLAKDVFGGSAVFAQLIDAVRFFFLSGHGAISLVDRILDRLHKIQNTLAKWDETYPAVS